MATEWRKVGKVKKLCIYPFKSGKRIEVKEAECTKQGFREVEKGHRKLLLRDRSFVVYEQNYLEYRSAKHFPKLVLLEVKSHDANSIALNAPGMEPLIIPIPTGKEVHIKQLRETIPLIDCGDKASTWISTYLQGDKPGLRIGYNNGTNKRSAEVHQKQIDYCNRGMTSDSMGLSSNMCAVMLNNAASIRDFQKKSGISEINENNFRPNILVDDDNLEPFLEDQWEYLKIGDVIFKNVLECVRCLLTTVDMDKGVLRSDREPLRTLGTYRVSNGPKKDPLMGIFLEVIKTGKVSLHDDVYVGNY
ncbi:mitochondrial amidoxime-reducing component 1-like isoform X2 [Diabrotica virgifera virgifera]|nr:mitochondrial amidoxime-reducing component 1-like isoform X2 [Diabrotica virgifera virgifera]XP_050508404.1 mitochondrial amidoxime-reducing component 1-like isoform X2 [Diabrotica virgifera virgifera]